MNDIFIPWQPREQQIYIQNKFQELVENNKKFLFVSAPVGIGKSQAVVMAAKWYKDNIDKDAKFDLITNQIILQNQYLRDFPFIKSIKGIERYKCQTYKTNCNVGNIIGKQKGKPCLSCTYKRERTIFQDSTIGVTNFHMFVSYLTYAPDVILMRKSKVLFIDEAHSFEEAYCSFINAEFSKKVLDEELGIWREAWMADLMSIKTIQDLANFTETFVIPSIMMRYESLIFEASKIPDNNPDKILTIEEASKIKRLKCKYSRFLQDRHRWENVNNDFGWKGNWELTIENPNTNKVDIKVEAIYGSYYFDEVWKNYDHIVFLSGTMLRKNHFMNVMGVSSKDADYVEIESPFPVKNRPIFYLDVATINYRDKVEAVAKMIPVIKDILLKHPNQKGIIHTTTFEIANWIKDALGKEFPRLGFHDSSKGSRDFLLNNHQTTSQPSVMVSPSMTTGVDLKDDLSRFQIIVKIPWPNKSNGKIRRKMEDNPTHYDWQTMCDLVQTYGRSVRSETDYAKTYILDSSFDRLRNSTRLKLPKFITEAIIIEEK